MRPEENKKRNVHPFITYLGGLERGDLAVLRRSASHISSFDSGAARVVYPRISATDTGSYREEPYFVVAALFALRPGREDAPNAGNLGASALHLALGRSSDGRPADAVARRFDRVLGSSRDELPHILRDFVGLIDTANAPVNFSLLLKHYHQWESTDRWVQRTWARSFWPPERNEPHTTGNNTTTVEGAS